MHNIIIIIISIIIIIIIIYWQRLTIKTDVSATSLPHCQGKLK